MSIKFAGLTIYTKNKKFLANFIAQLLDADILEVDNSPMITYEDISFNFQNIQDVDDRPTTTSLVSLSMTTLKFTVDSQETLEALLKKGQFLIYRLNDSTKDSMTLHLSGDSLSLLDIDGRTWNFFWTLVPKKL